MKESSQKQRGDHGAAIAAVFPNPATLDEFQRNDPVVAGRALPKFIGYAFEHGLIPHETEADLREMIERGRADRNPLPAGFSFGDLMDRIAADRSVNHLVEKDLRPLCRRLGLPDVQTSMISRLRGKFVPNTRGKQNFLRVLAFWIGLNRPRWGWDFQALMQVKSAEKPVLEIDPNDGVRLAFHVIGRGDVLEAEALAWLKREVVQCTKELELFYLDPAQIVAATTTVFVNLPRLRESQDVAVYSRALRDAFALVHQVLVRWALNGEHPGSRVVVAIAAGPFADLGTSLLAMLKARLPDGDVIRMTSLVRTCVNLSEIKIVFHPAPREVGIYAGDTLTVWVADSLWSHAYYDYVPAVAKLLPSDRDALAAFKGSLLLGDLRANPLLAAAHRQPENTLLLIEIAKSCIAKGLFHEADQFISIILADRPLQVVARTLRMVLRLNIALAQPDLSAAWLSFQEAVSEGRFILERCQVENEEVFCELGQVHFCIARRLYNALIRNRIESLRAAIRESSGDEPGSEEEARSQVRRLVLGHLREAQSYFDQGRTISPSGVGNRSLHWAFRIKALQRLLEMDGRAFALEGWPGQLVLDRHDVFRETAKRLFSSLGWVAELPERTKSYSEAEQVALFVGITRAYSQYENTVLARSYRATVQFAFAMLMFDFAPALTVGVLKLILKWLREAENVAAALADGQQGIHSIVTCCSQIQPASSMLEQVRRAIRSLTDRYSDALAREDEALIEEGRDHKFLLEAFGNEHLVDPRDLL